MAKTIDKVVCQNPNTGGTMKIDADVYEMFRRAIYHTLKQAKTPITYTDIVNGIKKRFKEQKTSFKGSVSWYAVTVKHDLVAKGIIRTWMEKGKRLHELKN